MCIHTYIHTYITYSAIDHNNSVPRGPPSKWVLSTMAEQYYMSNGLLSNSFTEFSMHPLIINSSTMASLYPSSISPFVHKGSGGRLGWLVPDRKQGGCVLVYTHTNIHSYTHTLIHSYTHTHTLTAQSKKSSKPNSKANSSHTSILLGHYPYSLFCTGKGPLLQKSPLQSPRSRVQEMLQRGGEMKDKYLSKVCTHIYTYIDHIFIYRYICMCVCVCVCVCVCACVCMYVCMSGIVCTDIQRSCVGLSTSSGYLHT